MIKRLFDWTPCDIAYWERIREKGLRHFVGWYGVMISGGVLFILFGLVTVFMWLKQFSGMRYTQTSLIYLVGELIFVALVCLIAGIINSLVTWVVEERLYRKYAQRTANQKAHDERRTG
jgi:hypothetical protein